MRKTLMNIIIRTLLIGILAFGFISLYQYNISQNVKAEAVAEEYDVPVNIINKRCYDGESIDELKAKLASGELIYHNGQLITTDCMSW